MEIGQLHGAREASSSLASTGPRDPAPAPTPAAPELRLMRFSQPGGSFSSSAIFPPAAAPAPPPPRSLCRPPTTTTDWLSLTCNQGPATMLIGHSNCRAWISGFLLHRHGSGRTLPHIYTWGPGPSLPPGRLHPAPPPFSPGPLSGGEGIYCSLLKALGRASKKSELLLCVFRHRAHTTGYGSSNSRLPKPFPEGRSPLYGSVWLVWR